MFDRKAISRAVDLSQRGYVLIRWLGDSVGRGFISADSAHSYASLPDAAFDWIRKHYDNLPPDGRPPRDELDAFCNLLSTYLEGSFDLHESPGQRLYSPEAHCFCRCCSWLVRVNNLRPKKLTSKQKTRAKRMIETTIRNAALTAGCDLNDEELQSLLDDREMYEAAALCAYAADLLQRLKGVTIGPTQLALWRSFAWEPTGSPKKQFELTATMIFEAEQQLHGYFKETRYALM